MVREMLEVRGEINNGSVKVYEYGVYKGSVSLKKLLEAINYVKTKNK